MDSPRCGWVFGTNSYVDTPGFIHIFLSIVVVHRSCSHALLFSISPRERERERESKREKEREKT